MFLGAVTVVLGAAETGLGAVAKGFSQGLRMKLPQQGEEYQRKSRCGNGIIRRN
jgi:hypothetical protein